MCINTFSDRIHGQVYIIFVFNFSDLLGLVRFVTFRLTAQRL